MEIKIFFFFVTEAVKVILANTVGWVLVYRNARKKCSGLHYVAFFEIYKSEWERNTYLIKKALDNYQF